jgi:hypothetical protein
LPLCDAIGIIKPQYFDCDASLGCQRLNPRFIPDKVRRPILDPWIKEWDQRTSLWIERANIRAFISITPKTSPRQIFDLSLSTMLAGHNMIGLMDMESVGLW